MEMAKILVNGTEVPETLDITDVRIERAMSATAMCDITIAASRTGGPQQALIPSTLTIGATLAVDGGPGANSLKRVFEGEIIAISFEIDVVLGEHVVVRAADKSHRLWATPSIVVSTKMKYSDVISKMASSFGLSAQVDSTPFSKEHHYDIQLGSAGEHLQSICSRHGAYWYVDKSVLHVLDATGEPSSTVSLAYGVDLRRVSGRATTAVPAQKLDVLAWDPKTAQGVSGTSGKVADLHTSALTTLADKVSTFSPQNGSTAAHVVDDASEATQRAKAQAARAVASRIQVRIECRKADALDKFVPGGAVELSSAGAELDGTYRIATVVHVMSGGQWRTTVTTGTIEPPTFGELVGAVSETPMWDTRTAVIGVVTDIEPRESDFRGMVLVKFPTLKTSNGVEAASAWARVVLPGAGPSRGLQVMPSVDDEVVVVFEQGDPRRPLVVGGLWNGQHAQPLAKDVFADGGNAGTWQLTTVGGRNIVLSDQKKYVSITCEETNLKLYLGEDKVELWAKPNTPLEVKSGQASLLMDKDGNVTIKGKKITLEATDDVEISGKDVKIDAKAKVKITGATGAEVATSMSASVKLDANVALTGLKVQING